MILRVEKSIVLNAGVSKVWEALTTSKWTRQYMFGCDVVSDWRVGGPLEFRDNAGVIQVKGAVKSFEKEKTLAFTVFGPTMGLKDIPSNYTTVTYNLRPGKESSQTELSVTQGDFNGVEDGEERYKHTAGGWELTLKKLKEVLEASTGNPVRS